MNLTEALRFTDAKKAAGWRSDGCTMAPELGIKKFCEMHDALRIFSPVSAWEADKLFFKGITTKGIRYYPVAMIYWVAVRIIYVLNIRWK